MMRYLLAIICILCAMSVWADDKADLTELRERMKLAEAPITRSNKASIERGAKFFSTNCMSCHTLIYLKYDKLAQAAGITYEKMPVNVKQWPFGVKPPDLSSEADVRGVNWIYTYLHSFYSDASRPTGANNLLVPDTAMPAILAPLQGEQVLAPLKEKQGGILTGNLQWYDLLVLTKQGSDTPEQFDGAVADLVNFLAYASEPFYEKQHKIGFWVLGFLVLLFIFMYLLKREYWRDVKSQRSEEQE